MGIWWRNGKRRCAVHCRSAVKWQTRWVAAAVVFAGENLRGLVASVAVGILEGHLRVLLTMGRILVD
jgi:hypothetical protein